MATYIIYFAIAYGTAFLVAFMLRHTDALEPINEKDLRKLYAKAIDIDFNKDGSISYEIENITIIFDIENGQLCSINIFKEPWSIKSTIISALVMGTIFYSILIFIDVTMMI